ncbi:MAG: hypothetical protein WAZ34_14065 [Rhodocyclaceae bacterium]
MKIHQLTNGARFEYEGEAYVKTGPMFATGKGGQRMIPKYAVLKPLGDGEAAQKRDTLPKARVLDAFDAFYAACQTLLPENRQPALDAARDRFLKALD